MLYVHAQGTRVPALGFGTWLMRGTEARDDVRHALELGYRHIDTAQVYDNEREVGEGIRASGLPREVVFVTTKVQLSKLRRDDVLSSTSESLERLGTGYVDLLLIHWPDEDVPIEETLGAMAELRDAGSVRHLGVSNFPPRLLEAALAVEPELMTNQVEYHPYLAQEELLSICREHGMFLTAYTPLARGRVLKDPVIGEIASRHGKSRAQVTLRWLVQQGDVCAIPKAASAEHRRANLDIFDFALSEDEMDLIAALEHGGRTSDPAWGPEWS